MAIEATEGKRTLGLRVATGETDEGKSTYSTRSFSDVSLTATNDQIYSAATKLSNMQANTLSDIYITRRDTLTESV